jgi:surface antigen
MKKLFSAFDLSSASSMFDYKNLYRTLKPKCSRWVLCAACVSVSSFCYGQNAIGTLGIMNGLLEGYLQGSQDAQTRQNYEQIGRDRAIALTDPRLLPLADGGISPYSQQLIFSALSEALEMDAAWNTRFWRNEQLGSSGSVRVFEKVVSPNGALCREFNLTLKPREAMEKSLHGTACREGVTWRWLSGIR